MKRNSFYVLMNLLILLTSEHAFTQEIRLKSITGLLDPGTITPGTVTFRFEYLFGPTETQSISNGFKVHSPDGALWNATSVNNTLMSTGLSEFDGNFTSSVLSNNGQLADTAIVSGLDLVAPGIPANAIRTVTEIRIDPTLSSQGMHICIDSCWFPPSGEWIWADAGGSQAVEWGGGTFAPQYSDGPNNGYCFTVSMSSPTIPAITNCPGTRSYDHCNTATYDFDANDAENDPLTFTLIGGPGSINPNTGVWTYSPTIADVGTSQQIIVGVSDWNSQGFPCTVNLSFTNVAPTMTRGCNFYYVGYTGFTYTFDFDASSGDCDPISYSLISVTPAPYGPYSFNTSTGVVSFTPAGKDLPTAFTFSVRASDGHNQTECNAYFEMLTGDPPVCGNIDNDLSNLVNILDVTRFVDFLFKGGFQPQPLAIADVNCSPDDKVNVIDLIYLVNYLFKGGPAPCAGC